MLYVKCKDGHTCSELPEIVDFEEGDKVFTMKFYVPGIAKDRISVKTKDRVFYVLIDGEPRYEFGIENWNDAMFSIKKRIIKTAPSSCHLDLGILTVDFEYNIPETDYETSYEIQ